MAAPPSSAALLVQPVVLDHYNVSTRKLKAAASHRSGAAKKDGPDLSFCKPQIKQAFCGAARRSKKNVGELRSEKAAQDLENPGRKDGGDGGNPPRIVGT
jgi:hypothetical protein